MNTFPAWHAARVVRIESGDRMCTVKVAKLPRTERPSDESILAVASAALAMEFEVGDDTAAEWLKSIDWERP